MDIFQLEYHDGVYFAPIDISVDEWISMLQNPSVFDQTSLDMLISWYNCPFHQATSKEVMERNHLSGQTPYNGIVCGLGKRVLKYLNRFKVYSTDGIGKSYFIIPFEGWHENYRRSGRFVWKIRDELCVAMEELGIVSKNDYQTHLPSDAVSSSVEGGKVCFFSTRYERDPSNRANAIRIHGYKCEICGFDFAEKYGERGRDYIEVHHIKPLSDLKTKILVDPAMDLICVCSNCHAMIHRRRHDTLSPDELRSMIKK